MTRLRRPQGDEGVSLVLALVFIVLVGLFATVALAKSQNTLSSGLQLRERGQLQYALDGAIDRGLQVLRSDMEDVDPDQCAQPAAPTASGTLALNGSTTTWTCTLLAGRAKNSSDSSATDYAIVVTSPNANALETQSGSDDLIVEGSLYVNGKVSNSSLNKVVSLTEGDYVSPASRSGCDADLAALTKVTIAAGYLKTCTDQTVQDAQPVVDLPPAPTAPSVSIGELSSAWAEVKTGSGKNQKTCRVFYPGLYTSPPELSTYNYFVSGLYYFNGIGTWGFDDSALRLTGGQRSVADDTPALTGDCSDMVMNDVTAMGQPQIAAIRAVIAGSTFTHGVTWVLGAGSSLDLNKGTVSLFTPPAGASSQPLSLVAFPSAVDGYTPIGGASPPLVVHGFSNNTNAHFNAKIFAPSARLELFSTNDTEAVARSGVVAYELKLQASNGGSGNGLAISGPPGKKNPPPPFRTVKIVATDTGGATSATNTTVATISNFNLYAVKVKSWRTAD